MIKLYCAEHNLVFVLGCTDVEQRYFIEKLIQDYIDPAPRVITADITIHDRKELYMQGGIFFITSRLINLKENKKNRKFFVTFLLFFQYFNS